jgi:uncharacterized membrane protein YdbT with pleckstrin-like domain
MEMHPSFAAYYVRTYGFSLVFAAALFASGIFIPQLKFDLPFEVVFFALGAFIVFFSALYSALHVRTTSVSLEGELIVHRTGIIASYKRSIPAGMVTDISVNASAADKLMGVSNLRINTSGSAEYEIIAEGFPAGQVEKMHDGIYGKMKGEKSRQ